MPAHLIPLPERLARRTRRTERGCLEWTGKVNHQGYGILEIRGRPTRAHRAAWFVAHGVWPTKPLLHSCDNPRCVEIAHLREGTQAENIGEAVKKGRLNMKGSRHHFSRLTEAQVRQIRQRYVQEDVSKADLARDYGVSPATVSLICRRKIWTHI